MRALHILDSGSDNHWVQWQRQSLKYLTCQNLDFAFARFSILGVVGVLYHFAGVPWRRDFRTVAAARRSFRPFGTAIVTRMGIKVSSFGGISVFSECVT